VTVEPPERTVKPNGKNRMNLRASPHPRQVPQVRCGPLPGIRETPSLPAIERSTESNVRFSDSGLNGSYCDLNHPRPALECRSRSVISWHACSREWRESGIPDSANRTPPLEPDDERGESVSHYRRPGWLALSRPHERSGVPAGPGARDPRARSEAVLPSRGYGTVWGAGKPSCSADKARGSRRGASLTA
jgi:hypothetical protein